MAPGKQQTASTPSFTSSRGTRLRVEVPDPPDPPQPTVLRVRGLVQHVLAERGYGFIRALDGVDAGQDFFFHQSCLLGCRIDQLREGSEVVFEPRRVAKGKRAERIERVEP